VKRWRLILAILLVAVGGYFLWRALRPEPEAPVRRGPVPSPSASAAAVQAARSLEDAIKAAFPTGTLVLGEDGGSPYAYDDSKLVEAPFGPVLVSHGHVPDAGHADAGRIAVHYLAPAETGYTLVRDWPKAIETGSMGDLSEWSVSDKFGDLPVVYAEGGGTFQGYSCATTILTELTPGGPKEVAAIRTLYDDQGAKDQGGQSYEGKIGDIVKGKGFTVTFTGTRSFTERYERRGDRYVLIGGKTQVPEC
jgi:hypothetical protein